jgi:anaerobic selenocysteine-containing dehydrogenase
MRLNAKELIQWTAFNRRNFIKLLVGGAVGIHLSPLPWKLIDDTAIWSQNWAWVPVPPEGDFSHVKTVCQLCPGGCGIEVRKVDARAVKIEGRTDYPVNPGGICPLGAGGLQLLYNEDLRFTGPMKRVGPKGSGQFVEIPWPEALRELANRLNGLRRAGKPETVMAVDGNAQRSTMSLMIRRLLEALGSPNYVRIPCAEDTYAMANRLMMGRDSSMAYDLENADFILSFGCGLVDGWGAPGRMLHAWGSWHNDPSKKKVSIVQVEPRASNTASKADKWLAALPGTEGALALGLAHVMVKEGLFNVSFVPDHTFGFADWTSADGKEHRGFKSLVLEKYPPEIVAKITGLNSGDIVSLARDFARAKAPVALCGKGKGYLNGSLLEFMAVQALNALVGNINQPGGVLVHPPLPLSPWPEVEKDAIAREGLMKARLDQAGSRRFPFAQSLINSLPEVIVEKSLSPVDTLLVFSANPAYCLPDGGAFHHALEKIPYVVSFSPYRDETALKADLILPDHSYLEKTEDIAWPSGLQYPLYGLSRPVVKPLYHTRQSGDVIIELAGLIGESVASSFPWKNFEEALKARAKGLFEAGGGLTGYDGSSPVWKGLDVRSAVHADYQSFDDMWQRMKSGGLWYRPTHEFKQWGTLFKTPTGKFEFSSTSIVQAVAALARESSPESALRNLGIGVGGDEACVPHYKRGKTDGETEKYPLLLMPYEMIQLASGWLPNPHFLNKTLFDNQLRREESFAEINPKTASQFGLRHGDRVIIESRKGRWAVRLNLSEGAMPGVLFLPLGLGHRAYDAYQQGKGVNPNEIVDGGRDPLSGHAVWWDTRVSLTKI